jgi:dTDP-4-amino-4,6-dideoxygalactose transaminase
VPPIPRLVDVHEGFAQAPESSLFLQRPSRIPHWRVQTLMLERGKHSISDLAMFGGSPAFSKPLHVGGPVVVDSARFLRRVEDALERGWFTNNGPYVQELERRVADVLGVEHCVATANATLALQLLIRAIGLSGEAIVPSFTFVATAHALYWEGVRPVFCDVSAETMTLDPAKVERLITPRTSAIVGVHLWGRACDVAELSAIADRHRLTLIFDAAHAFGCTHGGAPIGRFGRAEVFSFHATKIVHAFEGGVITTNDRELADQLRLMRNFGFADYDEVVCLGTNGKMSEAAAAMGLTTLEDFQQVVAANRDRYVLYRESLSGIPGIDVLAYDERERSNYQYVVALVDQVAAGLTRDELQSALLAENVLARRYFFPGCHRMEPYRSLDPASGERLPVTERLATSLLALPSGLSVSAEDIRQVSHLVRFLVAQSHALKGELERARETPPASVDPTWTVP